MRPWIMLLFILTTLCRAAILHVPADWPDLQNALDSCGTRDTVLVSQGTYHGQFVLPARTMTLMSHYETSGDSLDWLNCRLNGGGLGPTLLTTASPGDSLTISGFVIENGLGRVQSGLYGGGLAIREQIHVEAHHLVLQNNRVLTDLARGKAIAVYGDGASVILSDILVRSDSLTTGSDQVLLGSPARCEVRNFKIDGANDQGKAGFFYGNPLIVNGLEISGYELVPHFYATIESAEMMFLDDVRITNNSATGIFNAFVIPQHRTPSIRNFLFEGNQHLADCGSSLIESMLEFRGDSLALDGVTVRDNYEHCQHILRLRSEESTGLARHLVYENNRVGNGTYATDEGNQARRGQHITMVSTSMDSCRFEGNVTELSLNPQHPERGVAIYGALLDVIQHRDADSLVIDHCEIRNNLFIDPDDYSIHPRLANDGRGLYVEQYGGQGLRVSNCLFEGNQQPNHCPEEGLGSLSSVFYLYEYNDGQTGTLLENLVFRDNDDGTLTTTFDSRGVIRNVRLENNRRRGVFAAARSWIIENVLVEGQQAQDVLGPGNSSWQTAVGMNCFEGGEIRNCTIVGCELPSLVHSAFGTYPPTVIRNLVVADCQYGTLETVLSNPDDQVWAQWSYCYLPESPEEAGPGIVVDTAWPFDPEFEGGYVPALNGPLVDGGDPDPTLNDLEVPENTGFALWPSQGTLRNDMGYTGGPGAGALDHLVDVLSPRETPRALPDTIVLLPAYPNPFNPTTTLSYVLNRPLRLELSVYNVLGRKVRALTSGLESPGVHHVLFEAGELASGVYIVELNAGGESRTQKILLLK
ncbi:MAG: T9SS type A sorting domain-containing protein [Calditrichaeota bacterium]|nr:T9SS type A sorting domain-containing protein [Calditrichota bacterium]